MAGLVVASLSLHPDILSRTLLLQAFLLILYTAWMFNIKLAVIFGLCSTIIAIFSSTLTNDLIDFHKNSNDYRLGNIMTIFLFSPAEWILGSGLDIWQAKAANAFFFLPGADEYYSSANPHFFPVELIIRGGLFLFFLVSFYLYRLIISSRYGLITLVMLFGTFFTTNTGVERLYMTFAIYLLLNSQKEQCVLARISKSTTTKVGLSA